MMAEKQQGEKVVYDLNDTPTLPLFTICCVATFPCSAYLAVLAVSCLYDHPRFRGLAVGRRLV